MFPCFVLIADFNICVLKCKTETYIFSLEILDRLVIRNLACVASLIKHILKNSISSGIDLLSINAVISLIDNDKVLFY